MFNKRKFTLIELIVVIAVLGVLASIVIPNISGVQERGKVARTVSNIRNIQTAVDMYFMDYENYPTQLQPVEGIKEPIDYALLNIDYLRTQPSDNLTYVVDFNGIVSVLEDVLSGNTPQNPSNPIKLGNPTIVSNVDFSKQKVYTDTVISLNYVLSDIIEDTNVTILAEKWTVDGVEQSTKPNQTFSVGEHIVTLSLQYLPKTRSIEEYWTEETTFKFNIVNPNAVKRIAAGDYHTLALTESGQVYAWGLNSFGQLGYGSSGSQADMSTPILVASLSNVKDISAGSCHSLALTESGQVYAWGYNIYSQLGDGTNVSKNTPTLLSSISNVKQIAAGGFHNLALTEDGQVYSWGYNVQGQLGDGSNTTKTKPTLITAFSNIKEISAGSYHSLALTEGGQVYAFGNNSKGELGVGTNADKNTPTLISSLSYVKQISADHYYSMVLLENGQVYAWGFNGNGQLGDGTNVDKTTPNLISSLSHVKQIGTGSVHAFALTENGQLYAWGYNIFGQLGNGTNANTYLPILTTSISKIEQLSGGLHHSLALTENGEIYSWGGNPNGQVGDGTTEHRNTPILIKVK